MKKTILFSGFVQLLVPGLVLAAEPDAAAKKISFDLNPVVMDSKNGTGSTVGLEYKFKGDLLSRNFQSSDAGSSLDPNAIIGAAVPGINGSRSAAASSDRNTKKSMD